MTQHSWAGREGAPGAVNNVSQRLCQVPARGHGFARLPVLAASGLWWFPVAMAGLISTGVAAALSLPLHIPVVVPQLRFAWTVVRVLIEL